MPEKWYAFAIEEIERSTLRMTEWEQGFFKSVKQRVENGGSLSQAMEDSLVQLHRKMTEIRRLKR